MQIVPALAISVVIFGVPESPRWLAQKGQSDQATSTLSYVFDLPVDNPYISGELDAIFNAVLLEDAGRFHWKVLFIKDAIKTNYRVLLAFLVLFMNQVGCSRPRCLVKWLTAVYYIVDRNKCDCLLCTDST